MIDDVQNPPSNGAMHNVRGPQACLFDQPTVAEILCAGYFFNVLATAMFE
jgi:hypothetical protein